MWVGFRFYQRIRNKTWFGTTLDKCLTQLSTSIQKDTATAIWNLKTFWLTSISIFESSISPGRYLYQSAKTKVFLRLMESVQYQTWPLSSDLRFRMASKRTFSLSDVYCWQFTFVGIHLARKSKTIGYLFDHLMILKMNLRRDGKTYMTSIHREGKMYLRT